MRGCLQAAARGGATRPRRGRRFPPFCRPRARERAAARAAAAAAHGLPAPASAVAPVLASAANIQEGACRLAGTGRAAQGGGRGGRGRKEA